MLFRSAGKSASATVTDVKQVVNETSDKMDHNYRISYKFTVDGKKYTGSISRNKVFNASTLPSTGSQVAIKYVPAAPFINGDKNESPLTGLLLGGLGLVLMVFGVKPARKIPAQTRTDQPAPDTASG